MLLWKHEDASHRTHAEAGAAKRDGRRGRSRAAVSRGAGGWIAVEPRPHRQDLPRRRGAGVSQSGDSKALPTSGSGGAGTRLTCASGSDGSPHATTWSSSNARSATTAVPGSTGFSCSSSEATRWRASGSTSWRAGRPWSGGPRGVPTRPQTGRTEASCCRCSPQVLALVPAALTPPLRRSPRQPWDEAQIFARAGSEGLNGSNARCGDLQGGPNAQVPALGPV